MADEIEKAIIAATDAYTPYHTRTMAINQLIEFAETQEGWKTFVQKLFETERNEVLLYCISTLSDFASKRYSKLSQDEKNQLKEALFSFLYQKSSVLSQDAIMNKMALTIVIIFKNEFPDEWASFFDDISTMFLSTSENVVISKDMIDQVNPQSLPSPEFVLMYLNILVIIDQEIASSEISRSPDELIRNTATRIKDTMREIAIPKLVDTWYTILVLYHEQHVEVSKACLQVIKLYVSWIDIRLVVNNLFLPLLVKLISKKEYASGVIECLYEILLKGMPDPRNKLELIESLHVPEILQSLSFGSDESLEISASRVVGVLGTELLICINKLSYQIEKDIMLQNVVKNLLNNSLQLLFAYFNSENDEASQNLLQFSIMYLNHLRKLKESQSNQLNESSLEHLNILLQILFRKCKYHDNINNFNFETDNIDNDDFMDYRKDLNKLFLSITTLNPDLVAGFIASMIQNIGDIQDPFELEVIMHFFFLMGECVQDRMSSSALFFAEMILALATSQVVSYNQPHFVHTSFFEVVGRYSNQISSKPELIPILLELWVDRPGILNPHPKARERHCYLFTRFVKSLKDQLQPYLETIVNHLKGLVVFSPESFELMGREQQTDLFESIAFLVGSNKTATDIHQQYFNLLLTPLIDQIKEIMSKEMYINNNDVILWLKGIISAIGTFAKGFPLQVQGGERVVLSPNAVSYFTDSLGMISKVLSILYESYDIKESCSFFVNKVIVAIPYENYSPFIEDIIKNLITPLTLQNIICGVKLFLHFITIASSKGYPVIDKLFMPIVLQFIEVITKHEPFVTPKSEEERELTQVKNLYFEFLHYILTSSETNVLLSPTNIDHVSDILYTILLGCKTYDEIFVQKTSFSIFKGLTEQLGKKDEGFIYFVYQEVVPQLFEVPLNENFALDDGRTNEVFTEISNLELALFECRGEEFRNVLANYMNETLKENQADIDMYMNSLSQKHPKQFRKIKRNLLRNHK